MLSDSNINESDDREAKEMNINTGVGHKPEAKSQFHFFFFTSTLISRRHTSKLA